MAFSMLQELGGLGGTPDVGTNDADNSGNSVLSALENIGVNFAAGAAAVGVNALARNTGTAPQFAPYSSGSSLRLNQQQAAYNASLQARNNGPLVFGTGTLLVGGGLLLGTVFVLALLFRK